MVAAGRVVSIDIQHTIGPYTYWLFKDYFLFCFERFTKISNVKKVPPIDVVENLTKEKIVAKMMMNRGRSQCNTHELCKPIYQFKRLIQYMMRMRGKTTTNVGHLESRHIHFRNR